MFRKAVRLVGVGAVALSVATLAPAARADTVDANLTTLLTGHEDARDGKIYTVVPAYESLSLVADLTAPELDSLRIVASGWGMVGLGDAPYDGRTVTGDLDLAYLEATAFKRKLEVRLGRQIISGGAARMTQIDGATVELHGPWGTGVTTYGGAPVTPRFGTSRGDWVVGGRVYYRHAMDTEVGFSMIDVYGGGRAAREDLALDGRWQIHRTLALTSSWLWSIPNARTAEANAAMTWTPIGELEVSADYRRVAPDLFLPLNSIFTVFSQETRDEMGGMIYARPLPNIRIYADYHAVNDSSGWGHNGGAKATASIGQANDTTLGVEGRTLLLPTNGYWQARAFATQRLPGRLTVTVDGDAYFLTQAINGQTYSLTAAGTLGWDFGPGWRTVVTGIADVTPFVEHRVEFLAKLIYNYSYHFHEVSK